MSPAGFLIDLDGTLYRGTEAVDGAVATIALLRRRRIPFLLVTNTSSRSRAAVVARLHDFGFDVSVNDVMTAPLAATQWLREQGHGRIAPFLAPATLSDLDGIELAGGTAGTPAPDPVSAILIGDLGRAWSYDLLQEAYQHLSEGAELIACSRDRVYRGAEGLLLDAGPFVAALEYAAGKKAVITGKPSRSFYLAAVARLGLPEDAPIVMIGDDLHGDIQGAQNVGCEGWLVLTGKTTRDMLTSTEIKPDRVLDAIGSIQQELTHQTYAGERRAHSE